tara:strand:+ start:346 stop:618 length:273 start_codon:yes stop_codon:yes gene_type:complete
MEHKSVLMLRNRIVQLESQHNNLTSLVVSLIRNIEVLKKKVLSVEGISSSSQSVESVENDIQKLLNSTSRDNEDRTKELLEELKKAQISN